MTMKRTVVALLLSAGWCGNALGMNYLGPPTTTMERDQWAVGASYAYSEQDVHGNGVNSHEFRWQTALTTVHLGLDTDRAEVFGRVGMVDMGDVTGIKGSTDFAAGLGMRITTDPGETLSWGIAGQFLWWQKNDYLGDLNMFDIQIGLGPCWRPGSFVLYGGPLLHFVRGTVDHIGPAGDLREASWLAGYLGAGIDLNKHLMVTAEGQLTRDAFGLGVGVQWRF